MIAAGGSPADCKSRMYKIQKTIAAWTRMTTAAAKTQRRQGRLVLRRCRTVLAAPGHGFGIRRRYLRWLGLWRRALASADWVASRAASRPTSPIFK